MTPLFGFLFVSVFWGAVAWVGIHMIKEAKHYKGRKLARKFRQEQARRAADQWWNDYEKPEKRRIY